MRLGTSTERDWERREALRLFPQWMQWLLTEIIGKPLHDEPMPFRWRWWQRLALAITVGCLGLVGSSWFVAGGKLSWLLLPASWLATVSALRAFQTTFVHHASHGNLSRIPWLDKLIGESLSLLAWILPLKDYATGHIQGHHPRLALIDEPADPDLRFIVTEMDFRPGRSRRDYWLHLIWLLISPTFHARFFLARTRANLIEATPARRWLAWGFITTVVALVALTGSWVSFLLAVIVPWVWLYQCSGVLQVLTEHTWVRRGTGTISGKQVYARLTNARFTGVLPPAADLSTVRRTMAWLVWGLRMLFCCLPVRLFVLPGDLPQHDLHHRRPHSDWANAAYVRRDEVLAATSNDPSYPEVWGLTAAINATFDELGSLPPTAELGVPLTYGEKTDMLLHM